jgi:hypothetical protein
MTIIPASLAVVASASILLLASVASAGPGKGEPMHLKNGPHLLLDDALVDTQSNVVRAMQPPARLADPVVDGPHDHNFQPYVSVVRDEKTKRFRIWYGVPAEAPKGSPSHLAYMESTDGIHWIRPHRVLSDPGGIEVRFGCSVFDEGPEFANAAQRYKFGWYVGDVSTPPTGGLMVATSPDGLAWTPIAPKGPVLAHNHDINAIFRDPIRKRYGAIVSMILREPSHYAGRRVTCQSTSEDLLHWTTPWPILVPDEFDPPNTEFYAMGGVIARGDLLIGLVKVLRNDLPADPGGAAGGIGWTTLAWSRDGVSWVREREPFMERNPASGSWDHAMTWGDCQLPVDDQVYIYYGGYARGHKIERFTERQIGLARMGRDRYVARTAKGAATMRTPPLLLDAAALTVNAAIGADAGADAKDGAGLRVRVTDVSGKPIDGMDFKDCAVISGDSIAHDVRWAGGSTLKNVKDKPVRLEFSWTNGSLYTFDLLP